MRRTARVDHPCRDHFLCVLQSADRSSDAGQSARWCTAGIRAALYRARGLARLVKEGAVGFELAFARKWKQFHSGQQASHPSKHRHNAFEDTPEISLPACSNCWIWGEESGRVPRGTVAGEGASSREADVAQLCRRPSGASIVLHRRSLAAPVIAPKSQENATLEITSIARLHMRSVTCERTTDRRAGGQDPYSLLPPSPRSE